MVMVAEKVEGTAEVERAVVAREVVKVVAVKKKTKRSNNNSKKQQPMNNQVTIPLHTAPPPAPKPKKDLIPDPTTSMMYSFSSKQIEAHIACLTQPRKIKKSDMRKKCMPVLK